MMGTMLMSTINFTAAAKTYPGATGEVPCSRGLLITEEVQQRGVEQHRVLQEGEMADIGQNQEAGAGNRRGDVFGVKKAQNHGKCAGRADGFAGAR